MVIYMVSYLRLGSQTASTQWNQKDLARRGHNYTKKTSKKFMADTQNIVKHAINSDKVKSMCSVYIFVCMQFETSATDSEVN